LKQYKDKSTFEDINSEFRAIQNSGNVRQSQEEDDDFKEIRTQSLIGTKFALEDMLDEDIIEMSQRVTVKKTGGMIEQINSLKRKGVIEEEGDPKLFTSDYRQKDMK
jgi:hypothetical protein